MVTTRKWSRRLFSSLLCVAMLVTMVAIASTSVGAASIAEALEATPVAKPTLTFTAPEAIWLKQADTAGGATNKMHGFAAINAASGLTTTGAVTFTNLSGSTASNIVITGAYNGVETNVVKSISAATLPLGQTDTIPSGLLPNTTAFIDWKVTYELDGADAGSYSAHAYTVVYAPSTFVVGTTGTVDAGVGSTPNVETVRTSSFMGIVGLHSVKGNQDLAPSAAAYPDLNSLTYAAGTQTLSDVMYGASTTIAADRTIKNTARSGAAINNDGNFQHSSTIHPESGALNVDTSRFTSFGQIYGLKSMFVTTELRKIDTYSVPSAQTVRYGYARNPGFYLKMGPWNGSTLVPTGFNAEAPANTAAITPLSNIVAPAVTPYPSTVRYWWGVNWQSSTNANALTADNWNISIPTSSGKMLMFGFTDARIERIRNSDSGMEGASNIYSDHWIGFDVNPYNAAALRGRVLTAETTRYPDEVITNALAFNTSLKEAVEQLGTPTTTATDKTITAQTLVSNQSATAHYYKLGTTTPVDTALFGAGIPSATIIYTPGSTITAKELTIADHTFVYGTAPDGSFIFPLGGGVLAQSSKKTVATDTALVWTFYYAEATKYTLKFDPGAGTGAISDIINQNLSSTDTVPDETGMAPPAGKEFSHWEFIYNGNIVKVDEGVDIAELIKFYESKFEVAAPGEQPSLTLTAIWKNIVVDIYYTIAYDKTEGGGSAPTDQVVISTDTAITLHDWHYGSTMTEPTGKEFSSWKFQYAGADVFVGPANVVTALYENYASAFDSTLTLTLEAVWVDKAALYDFAYLPGGAGGAAPVMQTGPAGDGTPLAGAGTMTAPANTTFGGWSFMNNGKEVIVTGETLGNIIKFYPGAFAPAASGVNAKLTLTAKWVPVVVPTRYDFEYLPNTAAGTVNTTQTNLTAAAAAGLTVDDTTGMTPPPNTTFGGWTFEYNTILITVPNTYLLTNLIESYLGAFDTSGTNPKLTLTAVWVSKGTLYDFEYDMGSTTGTVDTSQTGLLAADAAGLFVDDSLGMAVPANTTFGGWSFTNNGKKVVVDAGSPLGNLIEFYPGAFTKAVGVNDKLKLTAVWVDNDAVYDFKYDLNGAARTFDADAPSQTGKLASTSELVLNYDANANTGAVTPPDNTTFGGWTFEHNLINITVPAGYLLSNLIESYLSAFAPATASENATLTLEAVWVSNGALYDFVYDMNGGTGTVDTPQPGLLAADTIGLTVDDASGMTAPTNTTFGGWFITNNGSQVQVAVGSDLSDLITYYPGAFAPATASDNATLTLTAKWNPVVVPALYDFIYKLPGATFVGDADEPSQDGEDAGTSAEVLDYDANAGTGLVLPPTNKHFIGWTFTYNLIEITVQPGYFLSDLIDGYLGAFDATPGKYTLTLTAVWVDNDALYDFVYLPGAGATGEAAPETQDDIPAADTTPLAGVGTMDGPANTHFGGWSFTNNGQKVVVATGETLGSIIKFYPGAFDPAALGVNAKLTLTAVWVDDDADYSFEYLPGTGASGTVDDTQANLAAAAVAGLTVDNTTGMIPPANKHFGGWTFSYNTILITVPETYLLTDLIKDYLGAFTKTGTSFELTLTAMWVDNAALYDFAYLPGAGATGEAAPETHDDIPPADTTPLAGVGTMTGPANTHFGGWSFTNNLSTVVVTNETLADIIKFYPGAFTKAAGVNDKLTLTAVWVDDDADYSFVYGLNGGTGTVDMTQTGLTAAAAAVLETDDALGMTPPANKHFVGWTFNYNGIDITVPAEHPLPNLIADYLGAFTKTGTSFELTLTAVWVDNAAVVVEYNANYDGLGGVPTIVDPVHYFASDTFLAMDGSSFFSKTGFTFIGWSETPGDTAATWAAGATVTAAESTAGSGKMVLNAIWEATSAAVTLDPNTGTAGTEDTLQYNNTSDKLAYDTDGYWGTGSITPTKAGYEFLGWSQTKYIESGAPAAGEALYPADRTTCAMVSAATAVSAITATPKTLYAVWSPYTFKIIYNANGALGTSAPADQDVAWDAGTVALATQGSMNRLGYTFMGWGETAASSPPDYPVDASGDSSVPDANDLLTAAPASGNVITTLYAIWSVNAITVQFNLNDGVTSPAIIPGADITVAYGQEYELDPTSATPNVFPANPTHPTPGKAFDGWYLEAACNTVVRLETLVMKSTDHEIYAGWRDTAIPQQLISLDPDGGTIPGYAQGVIVPDLVKNPNGSTVIISQYQPTKTGYSFAGWLSPDGKGTYDAATKSYTIDNQVPGNYADTIVAQWTPTPYNIRFIAKNPAIAQLGLTADGAFAAPPAGFTGSGGYTGLNDVAAAVSPSSENVPLPTGAKAPTCYGYTFKGWATQANGAVVYNNSLSDATLASLISETNNYKEKGQTLAAEVYPAGDTANNNGQVYLILYAVWQPIGADDPDLPDNPGANTPSGHNEYDPFDPDIANPKDDPTRGDDGLIMLYFVDGATTYNYAYTTAGVQMLPANIKAKTVTFGGTYGLLPQLARKNSIFVGWKIIAVGADAGSKWMGTYNPKESGGENGINVGDMLVAGTQVRTVKSVWVAPVWIDVLSKNTTIFTTKYASTFWNWMMFIFLFGWIWMWFVK